MAKDKKENAKKQEAENVENIENVEEVQPEETPAAEEPAVAEEVEQAAAPEGLPAEDVTFNEETPHNVDTVTVQPVEFVSFDNDSNPVGSENQNLEMLLDIKLELTVELGRCELPIKKILELTRDSIIELDKIAGEPVSLFANGKHIANGEVVVIEDNFGLRITSIIEPEKRLKSLE